MTGYQEILGLCSRNYSQRSIVRAAGWSRNTVERVLGTGMNKSYGLWNATSPTQSWRRCCSPARIKAGAGMWNWTTPTSIGKTWLYQKSVIPKAWREPANCSAFRAKNWYNVFGGKRRKYTANRIRRCIFGSAPGGRTF